MSFDIYEDDELSLPLDEDTDLVDEKELDEEPEDLEEE